MCKLMQMCGGRQGGVLNILPAFVCVRTGVAAAVCWQRLRDEGGGGGLKGATAGLQHVMGDGVWGEAEEGCVRTTQMQWGMGAGMDVQRRRD